MRPEQRSANCLSAGRAGELCQWLARRRLDNNNSNDLNLFQRSSSLNRHVAARRKKHIRPSGRKRLSRNQQSDGQIELIAAPAEALAAPHGRQFPSRRAHCVEPTHRHTHTHTHKRALAQIRRAQIVFVGATEAAAPTISAHIARFSFCQTFRRRRRLLLPEERRQRARRNLIASLIMMKYGDCWRRRRCHNFFFARPKSGQSPSECLSGAPRPAAPPVRRRRRQNRLTTRASERVSGGARHPLAREVS